MATTSKPPADRAILTRFVDEAYDKTAWHGPNLKGSIRRVKVDQAVWRARPGRRNIAEIVVHCAYWKYAVRRRIRGDKRGSFPLKGSNWFELPRRLTKEQWREYVVLLETEHRTLRETIATVPHSRLAGAASKNSGVAAHVHGVAMHDVYHAGQIQLIKVMHRQAVGR